MNKTAFAIIVISIFMLLPLNQVVRADVIEQTKIVQIDAAEIDSFEYDALLNIVNGDNFNYTNEQVLIRPFEEYNSVTGMISGGFLPPAKFQLDKPGDKNTNNHLILASTVEFNKKNLLSGASSSWWRCPYYFNYSIPQSRNAEITMSIYHVDLPRLANITFTHATNNYPVVPQPISNPSIVFTKTFSNVGAIQNDYQSFMYVSKDIPKNGTLTNPEEPFHPITNDYLYKTRFDYAHAWFNVSAPIYPNESYFVIWDIFDNNIGADYGGSFWITASDIGNNGYGRSLVSWNSQTIYEVPIDLDISVIFQTGMGAGVTGTKIQANPDGYLDRTSSYTNENFEYNEKLELADDFETTPIGTPNFFTGVTTDASIGHNNDNKNLEFYVGRTGNLRTSGNGGRDGMNKDTWAEIYREVSILVSREHQRWNFNLEMHDVDWVDISASPNVFYTTSSVKIAMLSYGYTIGGTFYSGNEQFSIIISRQKSLTPNATSGGFDIAYSNYIFWRKDDYTFGSVRLPDIMPNNMYISILSSRFFIYGVPFQRNFIYIYNQDVPNELFFSSELVSPYHSNSPTWHPSYYSNGLTISAAATVFDRDYALIDGMQKILTLRSYAHIERVDSTQTVLGLDEGINGWTITQPHSVNRAIYSKVNYRYPYEVNVPEYDTVNNYKCIEILQYTNQTTETSITQTSIVTPGVNKRYFAEGYFRFIPGTNSTLPVDDTWIEIQIAGYIGGITTYSTPKRHYLNDGSWHQISAGHLEGSFSRTSVIIRTNFQDISQIPRTELRRFQIDNIKVYGITPSSGDNYLFNYEFHQELDKKNWNVTNFYTFMFPFNFDDTPTVSPFVRIQFKNQAGTILNTLYSMPTDFYIDFIIFSVRTSDINTNSVYATINLVIFEYDAYIFLHDRNSQFYINTATNYDYNIFDSKSYTTLSDRTFFSPFYSFKTTEGMWINADSQYTTTYFYYVIVHFIRFNDNDPEQISIMIDTVDVQDMEMYRLKLKSFGTVYDSKEWVTYLNYMNQPGLLDKIIDAFARLGQWLLENTGLGQMFMAIGKFIYDAIVFLAPYIEALGNFILEAIVFIVSIVIYIFSVWIMWNFVQFWILLGEGRTNEAIERLSSIANKTTEIIKGGVTGASKMIPIKKGGK